MVQIRRGIKRDVVYMMETSGLYSTNSSSISWQRRTSCDSRWFIVTVFVVLLWRKTSSVLLGTARLEFCDLFKRFKVMKLKCSVEVDKLTNAYLGQLILLISIYFELFFSFSFSTKKNHDLYCLHFNIQQGKNVTQKSCMRHETPVLWK